MTIFAVFRVKNPASLGNAIEHEFKDDHLKVADHEWLISFTGTARELSDRLGITDGTNGSAMVFAMSGYSGRAATDIWEWIKTRLENGSRGAGGVLD